MKHLLAAWMARLLPGSARPKIARRSGKVCPACGKRHLRDVGRHAYATTFLRWGMIYREVAEALPQVLEGPQEYDVKRCPDCGLVFVTDFPGELVESVEASEIYESRIIAPYLANMQPLMDAARAERIARDDTDKATHEIHWHTVLRLVQPPLPAGARIAEIGSCYGAFAELMRRTLQPARLLACEANAKFLAELNRRYPHLETTGALIENWHRGQEFDLIYCSDVLEHIWDFPGFLRTAARYLAPEGRLVIVTPNVACESARQAGLDWWGYLLPHHCQLFTAEALAAAGTKAGLSVTATTTSFEELIVAFRPAR